MNHPADIREDYNFYADNRRRMARESIDAEYAVAIAFAAKVETLAKEADTLTAKLPINERYSQGETWADVAETLRGVVDSVMACTAQQLDELADIRVTGEGYA